MAVGRAAHRTAPRRAHRTAPGRSTARPSGGPPRGPRAVRRVPVVPICTNLGGWDGSGEPRALPVRHNDVLPVSLRKAVSASLLAASLTTLSTACGRQHTATGAPPSSRAGGGSHPGPTAVRSSLPVATPRRPRTPAPPHPRLSTPYLRSCDHPVGAGALTGNCFPDIRVSLAVSFNTPICLGLGGWERSVPRPGRVVPPAPRKSPRSRRGVTEEVVEDVTQEVVEEV